MGNFEGVWDKIRLCAGQGFETKTGLPFVYRVDGSKLTPDRTGYAIHRSQFEKAYDLMPLHAPSEINAVVRGPAYVYAILTDWRTRA